MGTGKVIFVSAVTAIIVSAGTFFGLRTLTAGGLSPPAATDGVVVPPLTGLNTDQARRLLEAKGLMLVVTEEREDPKVEVGGIASQTPMEGSKVKEGAQVRVVVSKGSPQAQVPPVARLAMATAVQQLTAAGFKVGAVTRQKSADLAKDHVISTAPPAGQQAARGTSVSLVVSEGQEAVEVPSVINRGSGRARKILEEAGFKVGRVTYAYDEDRREGVVIRQTPEAKSQAAPGTAVDLVVNEDD
jgi:serine/threonine-protein kinase